MVTVTINARPIAAITSSAATICNGESTSISGTISASGTWTLTLNGSLTTTGSGNGTWSKSVNPSANTTYTITALSDAHCTSISGDLTGSEIVTVNPLPTPSISGPTTTCANDTTSYTDTDVSAGSYTYEWTVSNGIITSGANSLHVTVKWNSNCVQGWVELTKTNTITGCSQTTGQYGVTIYSLPTPVISGSLTVSNSATNSSYSTPNVNGNLYSWTVIGGTIISGQGTSSIDINWGTCGTCTTGSVAVTETSINGCSASTTVNVTINQGSATLTGVVYYANDYSTPLTGVTVNLIKDGSVIATTTTGAGVVNMEPVMGYYEFNNIAYGDYSINLSSSKPWGGVNATDALLVQLNGGFTPFVQTIADVNASSSITALDALLIKMRVVGMTSSFAAGDWKFNGNSEIFTFSAINNSKDYSALCVGDVNKSYIPTGLKETSLMSTAEGIENVSINESFTYDIRSNQTAQLGAMTLFMSYDQNRFEIEKVNTLLDGMKYVVNNGQIALAWSDLRSISVNDNDPIISLQMRSKVAISDPTQIFTIEAGSEFADPNAVKLNNYTVKMANVATTTNGAKDLYITNYPNPFTSSTDIVYTLPETGKVKLVLTNMLGQTISTLVDGVQSAGSYKVTVSTSSLNLTPGVYTYRMEVEGTTTSFSRTNKVICK